MTKTEAAIIIYRSGEKLAVKLMYSLSKELCEAKKMISKLEKKINVLEGQAAKNSQNSHKPPSSERFNKVQPKSLREKTGRKTGGQNGHKGRTLKMVEQPNKIIVHSINRCKKCGCALEDKNSRSIEKRQVFDLPPIKIKVTEHRAEIKECPECNYQNKGIFPEGVKAPTQYGERIKSMIVYLRAYQLLPYHRTSELLYDLFNINLSQGTLDNITKSYANILQKPLTQIIDNIKGSPVANFDETGCRVIGRLHWLHVASNPKFTYFEVHQKRGKEAIDDIGILPHFKGRAVHDSFSSYFRYDGLHSLCNAHHMRELTYIHEQVGQVWAKQMKDCLIDIKKKVEDARQIDDHLPQYEIQEFETLYNLIIESGYYENPPPERSLRSKGTRGRQKKTKARNLLERLSQRKKEVLAFMYDFNVPFDNNQAERDIRMVRVQQKISGTFRSEHGAKDFCRIRSYIATARKNSINIIETIRSGIRDKPLLPT